MLFFLRIDPLDLLEGSRFVSFVGAGGKTTLIEWVAAAAARKGKRTVITTTTRIYAKEPYVVIDDYLPERMNNRGFIRVGKRVEEGKLTGVSEGEVLHLGENADMVLIEADGAKGRPLKCPAPYEPVIPECTDRVVVVAGLDALGGRADEKVFRRELCEKATGMDGQTRITRDLFLRFFSDDLLLKGVERSKCIIALNKYDRAGGGAHVLELGQQVAEKAGVPCVFITSALFGIFYALERA